MSASPPTGSSAPPPAVGRRLSHLAGRVVAACSHHAWLVLGLGLGLGAVSSAYVATHLSISTDTESLISRNVAWRRDASAFDRAFPGKTDEIVVVVDGRTAELAEAAADALAARLQARTDLFRGVARPDGGPFFDREGLLFLPRRETASTLDALIKAQPLLGPLAADPSLRGALQGLTTAVSQAQPKPAPLAELERPLREVGDMVEGALASRRVWVPWNRVLGSASEPGDLRRLLLLEPKLDYSELTPGARATAAVREAGRRLDLTPERGVTVRITGSVPLDDEQLGSLAEGVPVMTIAMLIAIVGLLWLAVRSPRTIAAILTTVFVGLAATAAFGLAAFGRFNLISVAFVALFVGLGIDFAIQFAVRFRAEQAEGVETSRAPAVAAVRMGGALAIAATTTAVGFFAFSPTRYVGFSELGVIAGVGMIAAFALSLTLLPALLVLMRPPGGAPDAGFRALAPVGRALAERRRGVLAIFAALGLGAAVLAPFVRFDFDPVSLDSPRTESVSTLRDLARNPDTTLQTLDVLAPDPEAARTLADRLAALPEVARAVTLTSFIPADQPAKLALVADAAGLLGPTFDPFVTLPAPTDADLVSALLITRAALLHATGPDRSPSSGQALRLARLLGQLATAPAAARTRAADAVSTTLPTLLAKARGALMAEPVNLRTLPPDLVRDWRAADGRVRVQVFPRGDAGDVATVNRFVTAVHHVAPGAVGDPVAVRGSQDTILQAFAAAMALSSVAIVALLWTVLRHARDVACTLIPVAFSALLTFASCVALHLAINFENIVAVPLLVSIGAAFTIYFTLAWRQGEGNLLDTSVARAIVFSGLTTGSAFGVLCLSPHPGTASLGLVLIIALAWTLVCTLVLQPALFGSQRSCTFGADISKE